MQNPYANRERELERKLQRLERKYDRGNEPQREYAQACADIRELLRTNKIDRDHADMLHASAFAKLQAYNDRQASVRRAERDRIAAAATMPIVFMVLLAMAIAIIAFIAYG